MCGIAGIISFTKKIQVDRVKRMTDAIKHRGPDSEGIWIHPDTQHVAFGHRRLSIIDLSDKASQPMHFLNRYTITFNGEIYNYIELRQQLEKFGYRFNTQSDTEVLLVLYHHYQEYCLKMLDGMFSFAIYDNENQDIFCARDRFGEKPFYYFFNQEQFVFASEIKALFAYGIPKEMNDKNIFYYLAYSSVEDPFCPDETVYRNIYKLHPGTYMKIKVSSQEYERKKYWDLAAIQTLEHTANLNEREVATEFFELLKASVKLRLRSDVPVGSSLSGGLDSSAIVCLMNELIKESALKTEQVVFSARFRGSALDEGHYMNLVKNQTHVQSYETFVDQQVLTDELEKIVYHQEEPFVSSSIAAQWEVMKLAKNHQIKVLLDGQGADEYLAGYLGYYKVFFSELKKYSKQSFHQQIQSYNDVHGLNYLENNSLNNSGLVNEMIKRARSIRNKYIIPSFMKDLNAEFSTTYKKFPNPYLQFDKLNDSLLHSTVNGALGNLLRYADKNSMAFSREIRLPFLDHKLVEYVTSLPPTFKINNGWTKFILRKAVEDLIPKEIVWRKDKIGYMPPQGEWLKNKRVVELLHESVEFLKKRGYVKSIDEDKKFSYMVTYLLLK